MHPAADLETPRGRTGEALSCRFGRFLCIDNWGQRNTLAYLTEEERWP